MDSNDDRKEIEDDFEARMSTLFNVGLFDLFTPEEWMKGDNAGRTLVGKLAQKQLANHKKN